MGVCHNTVQVVENPEEEQNEYRLKELNRFKRETEDYIEELERLTKLRDETNTEGKMAIQKKIQRVTDSLRTLKGRQVKLRYELKRGKEGFEEEITPNSSEVVEKIGISLSSNREEEVKKNIVSDLNNALNVDGKIIQIGDEMECLDILLDSKKDEEDNYEVKLVHYSICPKKDDEEECEGEEEEGEENDGEEEGPLPEIPKKMIIPRVEREVVDEVGSVMVTVSAMDVQ